MIEAPTASEAIFDVLVPRLESEGFEVFLNPSPRLLPKFLGTYRPDAIAIKGNRKVAIEIVQPGGDPIGDLQKLFDEHSDWELRIVYSTSLSSAPSMESLDRNVIESALDRLSIASEAGGPVAGLLMGWSAFEAAARTALPDELTRPQTPSRLLELLASDGLVTPDEADQLRRLARLRNQAAHGRLDIAVTPDDLTALTRAARTLLSLGAASAPSSVPKPSP